MTMGNNRQMDLTTLFKRNFQKSLTLKDCLKQGNFINEAKMTVYGIICTKNAFINAIIQ